MEKKHICFDLETTDLIEPTGKRLKPKEIKDIVQFSAYILNDEMEILETINIFNAEFKGTISYLESVNENVNYTNFVREKGISSKEFYQKIKNIFIENNIVSMITANGRGFDNIVLKTKLKSPTLLYLKKQHDTLVYENLILGCNNYGKMPDGSTVKRTLEDNCKRHGIVFDANEAHDGLYDCQKTFELFLFQKEYFENELNKELSNQEINFEF